ncbi:energy transducer TonB [Poseidonibacter sp.]|uniref:energy transducer TonB n=1 Tax=Poseidonibacter sp. TaxID=2321188 RepID=UPI003C755162
MNILTLVFSFIAVLALHIYAFSFTLKEKEQKVVHKTKYSKVSLQKATILEKKVVEKKIKKEKPKDTPIKKVVKKEVKKIPKKAIIKKPTIVKQKEIIKKPKKEQEKKIEKKVVKKDEPSKTNSINISKSLQKNEEFKENYISRLREFIDKNKQYPKMSKRLKEEGKVLLSFRVLKSGEFKNIKLLESSGNKRLDKAALNALISSERFEPFLEEINKNYMDFSLPIVFELL